MSRRAFTLIELLIVVAIIAILAAIAVPNFLEAQTRAKISRSKADLRTLVTAIESYRVDGNDIGPDTDDPDSAAWIAAHGGPIPNVPHPPDITVLGSTAAQQARLNYRSPRMWTPYTTPIAYITSIPADVFGGSNLLIAYNTYRYNAPNQFNGKRAYAIIYSMGPDKHITGLPTTSQALDFLYDPTNGTLSLGEIFRAAGINNLETAVQNHGAAFMQAVTSQ
jgi:prepilin-type N-terminal cleavage/methylation domain-containing protein